MRLEIIVPDSTGSDIKAMLLALTNRLTAQPELVKNIHLGREEELSDEVIQRLFTSERLAIIDAADADIAAGNGLSLDQLNTRLAANKASWLAENPS